MAHRVKQVFQVFPDASVGLRGEVRVFRQFYQLIKRAWTRLDWAMRKISATVNIGHVHRALS